MAEVVVVRQNREFETEFEAADPYASESEVQLVRDIQELTPYGMLLTSLGSCTTAVLHTYAQRHGVDLQEVEVRLIYARVFAEDCEDCEETGKHEEQITEELTLTGDLTSSERERLHRVAKYCPIYKILSQSINVVSRVG